MTPFQLHMAKWKNCTRCPLHIGRSRVVFSRGQLPCDILFIGEAPGKVEDLHGQAFKGPAGHLTDDIVKQALMSFIEGRNLLYRVCFTNLVACLSLGDDNKATPPDATCIQACNERLVEFVKIAQPKLIVCVGALASKWLDPKHRKHWTKKELFSVPADIPRVSIVHPSSMLSTNEAIGNHNRRQAIVTISNAIEKYLVKGEVEEPISNDVPFSAIEDDGYLDDDIPF